MDPRKDVPVTRRSVLNPNAAEFIPSALRSKYASTSSSALENLGSAENSGVAGTATNNSSNSSTYNDQNEQYRQYLLPDDITPEFESLEDYESSWPSPEDENKHIEFLVRTFPGFSEESLSHMYNACGGDLNFTIQALEDLEHQDDSSLHLESNIQSASGHKMNLSAGTSRSSQVPSSFTFNRIVADGNRQQTFSSPRRTHQQPSQVAVNAGERMGTGSLYSNLGEPIHGIYAQNAYLEQARQANLPARELIVPGQWHDGTVGLSPYREGELLYRPRNMTISQPQSTEAKVINLQGYDVNEAIRELKLAIATLLDTSWKTGQQQLLSIDIGSVCGSSMAAGLPLAVEQYLVDEKLHFSKAQPGVLQVLIS